MVFISYARDDYRDQNNQIIEGNCISKIEKLLDEEKLQYWRDERNIPLGDDWRRSIENEIKKAYVCLLFVTKNSCASKYVLEEIDAAIKYKVRVIPIFTIPHDEVFGLLSYYITTIQYVDYTKDIEDANRRLIDSINKILEERSSEKLFNDRLVQCYEQIAKVKTQLADYDKFKENLERELEELREEQKSLDMDIRRRETSIELLERKIEETTEDRETIQQEIDDLRKKINKNDGQKTAAMPDDPDNSDPTRFDDVEIKESEETIKGEAPEKENINQENQPESADSTEKSQGVDLKENNTKPNYQISDGMSALESYFKKSQKEN